MVASLRQRFCAGFARSRCIIFATSFSKRKECNQNWPSDLIGQVLGRKARLELKTDPLVATLPFALLMSSRFGTRCMLGSGTFRCCNLPDGLRHRPAASRCLPRMSNVMRRFAPEVRPTQGLRTLETDFL